MSGPRVGAADLVRVSFRGLRGQPLRFVLSVLGIAIGVAAMVAVGGITQSSRAELSSLLSRLGTNVLRVYPAPDLQGQPTRLPATASTMLANIGPVERTAAVSELPGVGVYRSPYVPSGNTNSLTVAAVAPDLLAVLHGQLSRGHWFTGAEQYFPTVVLGSSAAARLAIDDTGVRVWVRDQWCVVVGILAPLPLAPDLDSTAMVPVAAAARYLAADGTSTSVYVRAPDTRIREISAVVPATAAPEHPDQVGVDRPTDALTAKLTADATLNRLLIGLAAIGLLVGGVGVSNTMIIAVLERRSEIGLRCSLGATRRVIGLQFLTESVLMSASGGALGVVLGYAVTIGYARWQGWQLSLPLWVGAVAIAVTALVGSVAGLYPAVKASRESPTSALGS